MGRLRIKEQIAIEEFFSLIQSFIGNQITAKEFDLPYRRLYHLKADDVHIDPIEEILSDLFCDVDEYCSDDELRPHVKLAIDGDELYRRTLVNYNKLCTLLNFESTSD